MGRENKMKNTCFISGVERDKFEEAGFDFLEHNSNNPKATNHIWNYVYLLAHLGSKDEAEYTGGESHVSRLLAENSTAWMPNGTSLLFQRKHDQTEGKEENQEHTLHNLPHEVVELMEGKMEALVARLVKEQMAATAGKPNGIGGGTNADIPFQDEETARRSKLEAKEAEQDALAHRQKQLQTQLQVIGGLDNTTKVKIEGKLVQLQQRQETLQDEYDTLLFG